MDANLMDRCREDPAIFARAVLGVDLYDYQADLLRCPSRVTVCRGGRQVGKSYCAACKTLHHAFARPGSETLVVSAGESSAKYLMATVQRLAQGSELLKDCVLDELKGELRFSNGSSIVSVPASERQVRGRTCSLLVIDEARSVPESLWESAEPTTLAQPDSKVWIMSTPGGLVTGFFRRYYTRGVESPDEGCRSFWWPSTISPRVSKKLVEEWRRTWDPVAFRREVLGEDVDEAEAMFPMSLVLDCLADWEPFGPADAARWSAPYPDWDVERRGMRDLSCSVALGIDWGTVRDGNVVAAVGALDDGGANGEGHVYYLAHLDARYGTEYDDFMPVIMDVAGGFDARVVVSENNGVGAYPSTRIRKKIMAERRGTEVFCKATSGPIKLEVFALMHGLMCEGRFVLPRRDDVVSQFCGLSREETEAGNTVIAGRRSHDDIPMAVLQAFRAIQPADRPPDEVHDTWGPDYEHTRTGRGTIVPRVAVPERYHDRSWKIPK